MHLKENLRNHVAFCASFIEIAISAIVLIAIVVLSVHLIGDAVGLIRNPDIHESFSTFLSHALNLVVGVEFIKMLCRHTPGSAIEVLLFAIARQMVVEHTSPVENLITILTIALLFAIRKYLFVPTFGSGTRDKQEPAQAPPAAVAVSSSALDASE
ncbi:MAG: transporter [Subdoligranulum sp.]|nr:transporter [Subdoligranulum sp.]